MKRCFWLLNHPMLEIQKEDLKKNYAIEEFVMPPQTIANLWGNVPTSETVPNSYFEEIETWFADISTDDVVVVQGEPTVAFKIISELLKRGITVLAGITERRSVDKQLDGKVVKTSVFEHVCFRKYAE